MRTSSTRNAKIVDTLGAAGATRETVRALFIAGVDDFRLNFSHVNPADHRNRFAMLRELEQETGRTIGILDGRLGPKLRVCTFAHNPVVLASGAAFRQSFPMQV